MSNSKVPVRNGADGRGSGLVTFEPRAAAVHPRDDGAEVVGRSGADVVACSGASPSESVGNSKVPVREDGIVPPPGVPEVPCCIPPGTTVVEVITGGGGGGPTGTTDYRELSNKPRIEDVVLVGNRLLWEFGFGTATKYEVHQLFA